MKSLIKLFALMVLVSFVFSSCRAVTDRVLKLDESDKLLYLVAGFDEAAENTDVLFTLGFNRTEKMVYVAQIPRDTYYNFGGSQNKINQLYASLRASGVDKSIALDKTAKAISELFGTDFNGYFGLSIDSFKKIVDVLGGINIHLKSDLSLSFDEANQVITLKAGDNLINGEIAEKLVRYRSGYRRGDLARIDTQKIFLNALFSKLSNDTSATTLLNVVKSVADEIVTDMDLLEIARFFISNTTLNKDAKAMFATVPGEPIQDANGLSFYVLNRKSAAEISKRYMFAKNDFDKDKRCLNEDEPGFANIYEDNSISAREFSSEDLSG